jgi:hypothetical protein
MAIAVTAARRLAAQKSVAGYDAVFRTGSTDVDQTFGI